MTEWVRDAIGQGGYLAVFVLMFAETVFPPIPSELIMSLTGFAAAAGKMSLGIAILAGTAGAMLGNIAWYLFARALGLDRLRPLIDRHGRWLTMDWREIERCERWFARRRGLFVGIGRMLPSMRSLISVPAGLVRMRFLPFLLWSSLGTLGWTAMLAFAGWILGTRFGTMETLISIGSTVMIVAMASYYLWRVATWRPH
jgi:membrane protein DedA with SNARE-associated domain